MAPVVSARLNSRAAPARGDLGTQLEPQSLRSKPVGGHLHFRSTQLPLPLPLRRQPSAKDLSRCFPYAQRGARGSAFVLAESHREHRRRPRAASEPGRARSRSRPSSSFLCRWRTGHPVGDRTDAWGASVHLQRAHYATGHVARSEAIEQRDRARGQPAGLQCLEPVG